jgi:agmatinase
MEILQGLSKQGDIIGVDICEVAPDYDPSGSTSFLAAQVILNLLGYVFHERSKRSAAALPAR